MQIPAIPNYNSLMYSGCSLKYANFITHKRLYISGLKFTNEFQEMFMIFPFEFKLTDGTYGEYIGFNTFRLLKVEDDIDNQSLISLN